MHINSMPDLVLRLIFHKLSLQELLVAGRVCAIWKSHRFDITQKVDSLTLLFGGHNAHSLITNSCFTLKYRDQLLNADGTPMMHTPNYLHQFFHLTFDSFTSDGSAQLSSIFPHITTLEIAIKFVRGQFLLLPMVSLLSKWSPKLKTLKMYFQFNSTLFNYQPFLTKENNEFVNLFGVINSMQSLEHLTLDTDTEIYPLSPNYLNTSQSLNSPGHLPDLSNSIDLQILCRLREFYFKSSDNVNSIEKFLQSYAVPNDNLRQIGLDYRNIVSVYQRFPQLASKIVHLLLRYPAFNSTHVGNIFQPFGSITKLILINENGGRLFRDALNSISSLPLLEHLHVTNYCHGFFAFNITPPNRLPQLASVQVLTIATKSKSTSVFLSNHWARLFPNVQVIELVFTIISVNDDNINVSSLYLSKQQLQKTLIPFVHCPNLNHIFTCEKYFTSMISGIEHSPPEMSKKWILIPVGDSKIVNQVEE